MMIDDDNSQQRFINTTVFVRACLSDNRIEESAIRPYHHDKTNDYNNINN